MGAYLVTPNHSAMPFQSASHGVVGTTMPTSETILDPDDVKSSGYSPRIFPPFKDPEAAK